jgi:hypothetical protein
MFGLANSILVPLTIVVLGAVMMVGRHYFSADAREARRRARSHGAVISRKRGPSVRLATKVDKPKNSRKH